MPCCTRGWRSARSSSRAGRISDGMFAAAAGAVSSLVAVRQPGASLLPHIDDLRSVSVTVAVAVAEAAEAEGLAGSNWATSCNRCRTRCGSRSIAGSRPREGDRESCYE